jgi:hypothetical protein
MSDLAKPATRRALLTGSARLIGGAAVALAGGGALVSRVYANESGSTFDANEISDAVGNFFGTTAKASAEAVSRVFSDLGEPNAFVAGEEASAAFFGGLRYGDGYLYQRGAEPRRTYWQGPSVGFDVGGNASKMFALIYNMRSPEQLYQRFPGVEGTFYFVAGIGVNYMRAGGMTVAPMRTGAGVRAGVSVGYLHFTETQEWFPF